MSRVFEFIKRAVGFKPNAEMLKSAVFNYYFLNFLTNVCRLTFAKRSRH